MTEERFYVEQRGASWCVRDREIAIRYGAMAGQPLIVEWVTDELRARELADGLNRSRGRALDEPHCIECGQQPAGGNPPRCAVHHSRLADRQ